MQQIKSVGVLQTAKFFGALYLVTTAIFVIPIALIGALISIVGGKPEGLGILLLVLAPIGYGIVGFLFVAFGCWAYNVIAKRIGGIEIELR